MKQNPFISADQAEYEVSIYSVDDFVLECYVFYDSNEPLLFVKDQLTNQYHQVGFFYRICWDANEIRDELIPTISDLISRGKGSEVLVSELLSALAEPEFTFFSSKNDLGEGKQDALKDNSLMLRTTDFLKITSKWLEFLESLNKDGNQI